jgi:hypothetical protein
VSVLLHVVVCLESALFGGPTRDIAAPLCTAALAMYGNGAPPLHDDDSEEASTMTLTTAVVLVQAATATLALLHSGCHALTRDNHGCRDSLTASMPSKSIEEKLLSYIQPTTSGFPFLGSIYLH